MLYYTLCTEIHSWIHEAISSEVAPCVSIYKKVNTKAKDVDQRTKRARWVTQGRS